MRSDTVSPTASQHIARFSHRFGPAHLKPAHYAQVGRALIDTVGVALAGHREPATRCVAQYLAATSLQPPQTARSPHSARDAHAHAPAPVAWAWDQHAALHPADAALYNGVAGHVLDFDDVNSPLRGHPSIALLPALIALGQTHDVSGPRMVSAYVVGFEVMVRLARAMVQDHYARGWHATTTLGVIGAAAGCSHALELNDTQTVHALALAVAQAGGTRANFGTMAKSFQAGQCGSSAVRAALLAGCGLDGAVDALDGPQGLTRLYGQGESLADTWADLGRAPLEIEASGIEIKKYPMCYAAHRALDGMLDLRDEHGLEADQVQSIQVYANHRALVPLIHTQAQTGLEGKFSMHYAMAAALLDGHVGLSSFTDPAVQRPQAQAVMRRVTCMEDAGPATPRWNRLTVTLTCGQRLERTVHDLRGSAALPLSEEALRAKWRDCLSYAAATQDGDAFFEGAMALDRIGVRELMRRVPPLAAP